MAPSAWSACAAGQAPHPRAHRQRARSRQPVPRDQRPGRLPLGLHDRRRHGRRHRRHRRHRVRDPRQRPLGARRCPHALRRQEVDAGPRDRPRQPPCPTSASSSPPAPTCGSRPTARAGAGPRPSTSPRRGRFFYEMIELSQLEIPTVCVVFGSSTAGGAYQPGMSDYNIFIKEQSKVFLAGPPLVKMATGEESDDETLGGGQMHAETSGPGRLPRRGRDGRHPHVPGGRVPPQLAQGRPRAVAAARRAGPRPRRAARAGEPGPAPARRRARRHRPGRRRLPLRGVQGPLRPDARLRVGEHPRLSGGDPRQQRGHLPRRRPEGRPLHPALQPDRRAAAVPAEHHRVHGRARTSRPTASSRRARRCSTRSPTPRCRT